MKTVRTPGSRLAVVVAVADPGLEIVEPVTGRRRLYRPNVGSDNPVCRRETTFPGHEGPLGACPTFRVPAAHFEANVVTLALHFTGAGGPTVEPYDVVNHSLLHGHLQAGLPPDLSTADRSSRSDPFLVEHQLDPLP